jgi:hypothetical protein
MAIVFRPLARLGGEAPQNALALISRNLAPKNMVRSRRAWLRASFNVSSPPTNSWIFISGTPIPSANALPTYLLTRSSAECMVCAVDQLPTAVTNSYRESPTRWVLVFSWLRQRRHDARPRRSPPRTHGFHHTPLLGLLVARRILGPAGRRSSMWLSPGALSSCALLQSRTAVGTRTMMWFRWT